MEKPLPIKYENKKILVTDGLGFAWDRNTFIEFLKDEETAGFAVLGGDVVCRNPDTGVFKCNYDNWYLDRRGPNEKFSNYCLRSRQRALEYVENYPKGDEIAFAPVISSELTAGL